MINAQNYFIQVQTIDNEELSEHSLRTALENLLNEIKIQNHDLHHVSILQEGKRIGKSGVPDFRINSSQGSVGYVETKKIGENLHETAQSEQIKKYQELNDNILLTDYCTFWWLKGNTIVEKVDFCQAQDVGNKDAKFDAQKGQDLEKLIQNFLRETPKGVNNAHDLAKALAIRTRFLKESLLKLLEEQLANDEEVAMLKSLYFSLKQVVSEDLSTADFSDAYAQTLSYGWFLAKLNAEKNGNLTEEITFFNAQKFLPDSFALIRELLGFTSAIEREYGETDNAKWALKEILVIINHLDIQTIQKSLSFNQNLHQNSEVVADPYLYFYEDFLGQYDAKLRKAKGVYYTPPAVVNFIVRAIDHVLQKDFQIKSGLADKEKVTVLDFATGTGTFILEILKQIFEKIPQKSTKRQDIIQNHILKNIYGFEYLIAPYTVANLKLSQFLADNGYSLQKKDKFQIYLTNTLIPFNRQIQNMMPALSKEGLNAQNTKEKPILVICGNPPYAVSSGNKHSHIDKLLEKYKKGLNEKNIQSLSDDYIKFINFAHHKVATAGKGIMAVITNNSYLTGTIHRRMRETLLQDFDKIYILNLHGNSLKKEGDENVFDIRVGVSILIAVKTEKAQKKEVFYFSSKDNNIDKRQEKYKLCLENSLNSLNWQKIQPHAPNFWFVPKNLEGLDTYNTFWSVKDIFNFYSTGVTTHRDKLIVAHSKKELEKNIKYFYSLTHKEAESILKLKSTRDWNMKDALFNGKFDNGFIYSCAYRVLQKSYIYYDFSLIERGTNRYSMMQHFLNGENIGLVTTRLLSSEKFAHAFVTNTITERCFISNKGSEANYIFPLYVYEEIKNELDLNQNPEYAKKRKKLEKEFEPFVEMLEENKTVSENLTDTKQKTVFLEMASKVFEEQTACYEKKLANLQSEYEAQKQNGNGYQKRENFTPAFQKFLEKYNENATPEQVLAYLYAVLHSPRYRQKYADFLKMDFPKVPFVENVEQFENLSKIGQELIDAHLLKKIPDLEVGLPIGNGTNEVLDIRFVPAPALPQQGREFEYGKLYYNKNHYFDKVSSEIWEFQIGGYRVLEKYLKDRKGEILENEEILHIEKVIKVLAFTLQKMIEIDQI